MKKILLPAIATLGVTIGCFSAAVAQSGLPLSEQTVHTAMKVWPDSFSLEPGKRARWSYDQGVILKGVEDVWYATGKVEYFNYIQKCMDFFVNEDGTIKDYRPDEYNIDHINNGRMVMLLYRVTGKEKYRKAVQLLRNQLLTHPRTKEGGFWHKNIYPWQMWLDGLYMGQPFYAEYAQVFGEDTCFNDIANQFVWMEKHARDAKTGLLYHGWDESRTQKWANPQTGNSPHFWGRALGWYGMAIVDMLDFFPENHPRRPELIAILNRLAEAVTKVQDASGTWYDIVDMPNEPGNYKEASASCMLVYTLAKATRLHYIPVKYRANAQRGYEGIVKEFIKVENGQTNLHGTVSVSGLGGNPYRDGSFKYYMSEKLRVNDGKGLGAFIQAAAEIEMIPSLSVADNKVVLLDRYFNSEIRKNAGGKDGYWHYVWNEKSHPGFYAWGQLFKKYGAGLASLDAAPTKASLKGSDVYIIVDPDHTRDNPAPNFVQQTHVEVIKKWVKSGGTLMLMANDSNNCDLTHFNLLAGAFGINFTNLSRNMVKNDTYEQGLVMSGDNEVFSGNYKMFLKELSTLEVKSPATPLVSKDGEVIIAIARYGKGKVFVVGDPWLYNEYVDGRKLPAEFKNHLAADQLAKWLLSK
jgi:unsaturated rhamnogalacturonyl hydrolase